MTELSISPDEIRDAFQEDPAVRAVVLGITVGVGITLTAAEEGLFLEQAWTPGDLDQAEGRFYGRVNDAHGGVATYLLAADTIDEWLEIVEFVQRTMPHDEAAELRGPGRSIHLHATDTSPEVDAEWLVELTEDVVRWRRGHEKATVALRGPLTEVLLAFYRRLPPDGGELEVLGDRELLDFWLRRATFG